MGQKSICKKTPLNQWKNILQLGKILEAFVATWKIPIIQKKPYEVKEIQITFSLSQKFDFTSQTKSFDLPFYPKDTHIE